MNKSILPIATWGYISMVEESNIDDCCDFKQSLGSVVKYIYYHMKNNDPEVKIYEITN